MISLRVYDSGKKYDGCPDRYALYVPTPRKRIHEWGFKAIYLGFSFNENHIIRCIWSEWNTPICLGMGRRIKRETLPQHVQDWINGMEQKYNNALTLDTEEAWDIWNKA